MTVIIGAGMAGCLAGYAFPDAPIYEQDVAPPDRHKAVLRFRDGSVSALTGIPFIKVKVHKALWHYGREVEVSPRFANLYSSKVIGRILDRSIWNLIPAERYVGPTDFHARMLKHHHKRIHYGSGLTFIDSKLGIIGNQIRGLAEPIISTIPLNRIVNILGMETKAQFNFRETTTVNGTVENCNVHSTVYYPDHALAPYRATLTGNKLIVECIRTPDKGDLREVCWSLGFSYEQVEWDEQEYKMQYGKISEIEEDERKRLILELSMRYNVFSLGRYATWRNILLDDVAEDTSSIGRMISSDMFNMIRARSKE